ncbi:hypothetical protein CEXT_210161 [Caerostris extrusa]|uniref:Uncharacterized protein n=1 Tax=Caerostris extrusa TaxID=172846 RepID=A0AAV4X7Q1_CAEEX|nr:hypothetical protein CEXT_210161 [Caerostris extrusa]
MVILLMTCSLPIQKYILQNGSIKCKKAIQKAYSNTVLQLVSQPKIYSYRFHQSQLSEKLKSEGEKTKFSKKPFFQKAPNLPNGFSNTNSADVRGKAMPEGTRRINLN